MFVYAAFVHALVHQRFSTEIDHRLDQEIEIAERSLAQEHSGQPVWRAPHETDDDYWPLKNVTWLDVRFPDGTLIHRTPETDVKGTAAEIPPLRSVLRDFSRWN